MFKNLITKEMETFFKSKMDMKGFIASILILMMVIANNPLDVNAVASATVKIVVDGKEVKMASTYGSPFIADSRTYVPIRMVSVALGKSDDSVKWDAAARTVIVDGKIKFKIGSNVMTTDKGEVKMQVSPIIKGGRTYIPFKYLISDAFGLEYEFKQESGYNWLYIYKDTKPGGDVVVPEIPQNPTPITDEEKNKYLNDITRSNIYSGPAISNSKITTLFESKDFMNNMKALGYDFGDELNTESSTVTIDPYGVNGPQASIRVDPAENGWKVEVKAWDEKVEKALDSTISAITGKEFSNWFLYGDYSTKNYPQDKWYTKNGVQFYDQSGTFTLYFKK